MNAELEPEHVYVRPRGSRRDLQLPADLRGCATHRHQRENAALPIGERHAAGYVCVIHRVRG
jgi:hypothetical protein